MTQVAILGTGLIGSSIGLSLHASRAIPDVEVIGYDRYRDSTSAAQKMGAIDRAVNDPRDAVKGAALVILSAPILSNHRLMEEIASALQPHTVVTDTGSTKAETMRQAKLLLPTTVSFVGGHPMAGKTQTGAKAAEAGLFKDARWVVVAPPNAPERAIDAVVHLAQSTGAEPMLMDAEEHDAYVAAISHLPLVAAISLFRLVRASEAWPELSLLAAGGLKDTTRLAGTDPPLSYDMIVTNREQIAHWIDRLRETLAELRDKVTNLEGEEDLFKILASTEWEYASFRGGKIGREVKSNVPDAAAFDIQSFIMGEAIKDKMNAISKDQDQRLKDQEERRRFRREI